MNRFESSLKTRDAWSTVLVYDKIALPILQYLDNRKILVSPHHISFVGLMLGVIASALIITNNYLIAVFALQLTNIIDCMDGKWARYTGKSSNTGRLVDAWVDIYSQGVVGIIILTILLKEENILFIPFFLSTILLVSLHLKEILFKQQRKTNLESNSSWALWTKKYRLKLRPVEEVELAFLVPSLILLNLLNIVNDGFIWLIYALYFTSGVATWILKKYQ